MLDIIRHFDLVIYTFLNGFADNRLFNYIAAFEASNQLLRGALAVAVYWFFWFREGPDIERRRRTIIATMVGALAALVAARVIAVLGPFRVRPMFDLHIQHLPYVLQPKPDLVNWSSFPSDNAALFFALAFGLAVLSRRLALPAMLYAAGWICLPRMFQGVHYASDVAVGALIGIIAVWVSLRAERLQPAFASWVLKRADANPGFFYAAGFLASFEMGTLFDDIRSTAVRIVHASRVHHTELIGAGLPALVIFVCSAVLTHLILSAAKAKNTSSDIAAVRLAPEAAFASAVGKDSLTTQFNR